jgi:hypothetical protein
VAFPLRSDGTGSIGSGRSTDAWWQTVMDMLMNSSEIIVMDVSHVGKGSAWEIHALERWGFEELLPRALQPELLVYNQKGIFDDPAELRSVLESAVAGALTALAKQNA